MIPALCPIYAPMPIPLIELCDAEYLEPSLTFVCQIASLFGSALQKSSRFECVVNFHRESPG
jgi:hypothetical protein